MPKQREKLSERVNFRLTPDVRRLVEYYSDLEGKRVSPVMDDAIFEKVKWVLDNVETSVHVLVGLHRNHACRGKPGRSTC